MSLSGIRICLLQPYGTTSNSHLAGNGLVSAASALTLQRFFSVEAGAIYWTVPAPDIVNLGREEQGAEASASS
jgi:hypothetical protein